MRSPFPGMDPYLESRWLNIHARLVSLIADAINEVLPPDLVAFVEERISIEPDHELGVRRDVVVRKDPGAEKAPALGDVGAEATSLGLLRVTAQVDPVFEHFIRVADVASDHAVVVVELISPSNKQGEGLRSYKAKRAALLEQGTHVVEVDLTRRGNWKSLMLPHVLPPDAQTHYRLATRLTNDAAGVHVHHFTLREPIPDLKVPLRAGESPVIVPLSTLVTDVYRLSRAATWIRYGDPLDPPLAADDAAWAADLLASRPS